MFYCRDRFKITSDVPVHVRTKQHGFTAAGGHGQGSNNNQLDHPFGLFIDDDKDQTILVADLNNHRIMQWKKGDTNGEVVAGGNGRGNRLDQLLFPIDVLVDKETNSLIIADWGNERVVRWSRRNGSIQGEAIIDNITCVALAMDEQRNLYVSDADNNEIRRYEISQGDKKGVTVAGGNGIGNKLNQLNEPRYLFVDKNQSVYVSDSKNHRVMKWYKGAREGIVVAGGKGAGNALTQLWLPNGVFVDTSGTVYVAEGNNDRVTRWPEGSQEGSIFVGGNGRGHRTNQLSVLEDLSFDRHGNLYVVDSSNHRIQRFSRETIPDLGINAQWKQDASTVAGGYGRGEKKNQLDSPLGLFIDDDNEQTIVVADLNNHRIMQWKKGDTNGEVVAGGNGPGNRLDQLYHPHDVLIEKETNSLIISDTGNNRVVRWSRRSGTAQGQILIDNITCVGLAMDEHRNLYVADVKNNVVRRYKTNEGDKTGTLATDSDRNGTGFHGWTKPRYLFVDKNQSIYASDWKSHRVIRWDSNLREGTIVAGGKRVGNSVSQLWYPNGVFVDMTGAIYVAEGNNDRVTYWPRGSNRGSVVVGGNGQGNKSNQLHAAACLTFDRHGNLYVVDHGNHRVQRFDRNVTVDLPVIKPPKQHGFIAAGGHGQGSNNNQLDHPFGLFIDDDKDQTILVADLNNHRIMQWKKGDTNGEVVAGGNDQGNRLDQLSFPIDVLVDKETNSLIIADMGNERVVRWSRRNGSIQGEAIIDNITCVALAMDEQRNLYVSDADNNEIRRYEISQGDKKGVTVAGGNGIGNKLNQLNEPRYLFVDKNQSVYVSDSKNHRVMKWYKGAKEGIVVAGGKGAGNALTQLWLPNGVFVDTSGTVYVAEGNNDRVTRWPEGSQEGSIVVGDNGRGHRTNQLSVLEDLSFDRHGNLYVVDSSNHRIERFRAYE